MQPLNIKPELDAKQKEFLSHFPHTLFCYIPDHNDALPVMHSERLLLENQKQGYGVYFTVNGFTGGKRTADTLTNVNAFFADIDYPHKLDRTPEKLKAYKQDILMELMADELPIPKYIVETKNGLHVYWLLSEPIFLNNLNPDQQNNLRKQYVQIEEAILKRFDGDPGAKDVARVLRVPGTWHQKDPADPFLCTLVHASLGDECEYTFSEMREAFLKKEEPIGWAVASAENAINDDVKKVIEKEYPRLERPSYKKLFDKVPGAVPEGGRNKALLIAAHAAKEAGWSFEKTCEHFSDFYGLGLREIRKTIRSAYDHTYDFGYNNEIMSQVVTGEERKKLSDITSKAVAKSTKAVRDAGNDKQKKMYEMYEMVIAHRFPNLKYKSRGDFYNYFGGVYKPLQVSEVQSIYFQEMLQDGLTNYRKVSSINDKIAAFKSLDGRTFYHHEENPNPNIVNLKNGLLDISTYQLHEHTPNYLSTTQIPLIYQPGAAAPIWIRFVAEITDNDPEQQKLLQQIAGYCLTTDTSFAKAFIFFGSGANGKSMFTRMLAKIVGREDVSSINLTTLTKQFGLTGLVGKKVNLIDEISGHYFESNVIKGIISGEPMSAEVKYRPEPLEFTPTAKIIFSVNELPKINDTTPGLYRRFIIVPFDRSFEQNPDLQLEDKLTRELPGILNWAVEGLKILRADGRFNETERNFKAMQVFKQDNSPMVEFISNYYQPVPEGEEKKYELQIGTLYAQYKNYCYDHGYKPKALSNFSREIAHSRIDGFKILKRMEGPRTMVQGIRRNETLSGEEIVYGI